MPGGTRDDPFSVANFIVEIDGITKAGFSEVSGLTVEMTVIEYRTGSEDTTVRKLPGLKKFANITLKRGVTSDLSLWTWMRRTLDGQVLRTNMTIVLLNEARQPAVRWNVREAWPCKYESSDLNAKGNDVAIEMVEICHEGIELAT